MVSSASIALLTALAIGSHSSSKAAVNDGIGSPRVYQVRQTTKLDQIPSGTKSLQWWISIPSDDRFQEVLDFHVISSPGTWKIERDLERGNRFLLVEARDIGQSELETVVEFRVRRRPVWVQVDPAKVGPIVASHWTAMADELRTDAPHMTVTEEIQTMADGVCGPDRNPASQAHKLLAHVANLADHYSKDSSKPKCGVGDAADCLANLGGCCTDLHSLFIALARSRGIPARLQMGYRVLEKNLGKEVDPGYRCWVEYFLPSYGWVCADIVEADAIDGLGPGRWFTGLTERRVWLNEGREFAFPSAPPGTRVNTMSLGWALLDGRAARILPEGELAPQLTRKVLFTELAESAGDSAGITAEQVPAKHQTSQGQ